MWVLAYLATVAERLRSLGPRAFLTWTAYTRLKHGVSMLIDYMTNASIVSTDSLSRSGNRWSTGFSAEGCEMYVPVLNLPVLCFAPPPNT